MNPNAPHKTSVAEMLKSAVRNASSRHLIIRSSWIFVSRGRNFAMSMVDLMNKKDTLHIVHDQVVAPTWARYIADASGSMIKTVMTGNQVNTGELFGTYHLSSASYCSWYELTKKIRQLMEDSGFSRPVQIRSTTSKVYKTAAQRPLYSVLDNGKVNRLFALNRVDWETALGLCLAEVCD